MRNACLCLLFFLGLPALAKAAAWTLPADRFEAYTNAFYYSTSDYFDAAGKRQSQPRYRKYEINPYLEYGFLDGTTLGASWGMDAVQGTQVSGTTGRSGTNLGISDPSLHLRQRLWQDDRTVIAAQPLLKFPSHFEDERLPVTGSEHYDAELRLLGGRSFEWLGRSHFVNLETAYRKRFGAPGDQWISNLTLGFRLDDTWMILPELSYTHSLNGEQSSFTQSGSDNYDLLKPQISAVYTLNDATAIQAGIFRHLDGVNTGAGGGAMISLWYRP